MEKRLRIKRCNVVPSRQSECDPPCIILRPCDPQYAAKDMLFELSNNQNSPQAQNSLQINQWLTAPDHSLAESPFSSTKKLTSQHKSLYITRNHAAKIRTQTSQQRHLQFSVIPHLKSYLQKLESPDKTKPQEKRKEGKNQKPTETDENFEFNIIRTAAMTPKHCNRPKNASLYKKMKKSIFIHNFTEGKARNLPLREKTHYEAGEIGEKIQLMKEARRNRTLRKLLF